MRMSKVVKTITISSEVWDFLQKQGNASGYINDLVMKQLGDDVPKPKFTKAINPEQQQLDIYNNIKNQLTREQFNSIAKLQALDFDASGMGSLTFHSMDRFRQKEKWEACLAYWRRQAKALYNQDV